MADERKSRILFSALIAIGVPLLVFIAVPFEIWCNNIEELNYYFSDIFGFLFVLFIVSAIAIFSALFLVPEMPYKVLRGLAIGGGLMIFLQANYLNIGLNGLAGDEGISVVASVGLPMVIVNTLVWAVVITGCTVASILVKKVEITKMASVVLALVICFTQVMNIFVGVISTDFDKANISAQLKREDPNYQLSFLTNKNLTTVGQDRNVVVFVVDRFDAVDFCEPNIDLVQGYIDDFGGFTYFNDNISMYGKTYPSVVYMLTREEIETNETKKNYCRRVFQNNHTLSKLNDEGYDVNIYTDSYYGYYDAYHFPNYVDNVERVSEGSVYREVKWLQGLYVSSLKLSLYRALPMFLKDISAGVSTSSINTHVSFGSSELTNSITSSHMDVMREELTQKNFEIQTDKNFSFVHVDGCHSVFYDDNGAYGKDVRTALTESFTIIKRYIDEMKRLGVYDNSTIIITGDHGAMFNGLDKAKMTALFVKPSNHVGTAMQTSTAQVSHENLWATIFKSEGIAFDETEFGDSVFDIDPSVDTQRKFLWLLPRDVKLNNNEETYSIVGNGRDFTNWQLESVVEWDKPLHD